MNPHALVRSTAFSLCLLGLPGCRGEHSERAESPRSRDSAASPAGRNSPFDLRGLPVVTPAYMPNTALLSALASACDTFGTTERDIVAALGPPRERIIRSTINDFTPTLDSVVHLQYHGLQFDLLRVTNLQREFLVGVAVERSQPHLGPVWVGMSRHELGAALSPEGALGPLPSDTVVGIAVQDEGLGVKFLIIAGIVRRVECNSEL